MALRPNATSIVRHSLLFPACAACVAAMSTLFLAGCDEGYTPPASSGSTTTAPAAKSDTAAAPAVDDTKRERISLSSIPFTIEVPAGWSVQSGVANKFVLHGKAPSSEVEILVGPGPTIKPAAVPMLVKSSTTQSTDRHTKTEVVQRGDLTIIKTIARQLAPGAVAPSDPELIPIGWTVQIIRSDAKADLTSKIELPTYELQFVGLSQATFDKDEAFLQKIMESVQYDPSAATANP